MAEKSYRVHVSPPLTLTLSNLMTRRQAEAWAKKHIADCLSVGRVVIAELYYQGDQTPIKVFRDGTVIDRFEEGDRTRQKRRKALRKLGIGPVVADRIVYEVPPNIAWLKKVKGVGAKTIEREGKNILRIISTRWCDL